MSTSIVGEDGELRWAPNDFGTYSVEKIQEITKILSGLLESIKVSVEMDDSNKNYYTKEETDTKLLSYFLKTDFQDYLGSQINDIIGAYIQSQENMGQIVTADTIARMKKVIGFLTRVCFDQSYSQMEGTDTESTNPYNYRINSLETNLSSTRNIVDSLVSDFYTEPSLRYGFNFVRKSSITTTTDNSTDKVPSASLEYSLRLMVNGLRNDFYTNPTLGSGIKFISTSNVTSVSSNNTNLIPTASLEYDLRNRVNSLETKASTIGDALFNNPSTLSNVKFINKDDIITTSTNSTTKIPSASLEYSLRNSVNSLSSSVSDIVSDLYTSPSSMSGVKFINKDDIATTSTNSTTKVSSASLEYELRNIVNNIVSKMNNDVSYDSLLGVAFGTSLTYRSSTTGGYLQYLPGLSGITFDNQGVGSSVILGGSNNLNMLSKIKSYSLFSSKQVCLVEGFVNDWYEDKDLGTYTDTSETTVCGCVRSALEYILSQNNRISLFLVLDPYGRNYGGTNCESSAKNGSDLTQYVFYEEISKVAKSMGVPVIKEYEGSRISENTPQYFLDNIHHNALGARQSAYYIWSVMKQYYPSAT